MRRFGICGVVVWLGVIVAACSGESAGISGGDGGGDASADAANPPDCPATSPSSGGACASSGLRCTYGCNVTASCNAGVWSVVATAIPCPVDAAVPDGPRVLPDGAIVCSSDPDCRSPNGGSFLTCSPGGRITGCGICFSPPNPCNNDNDCLTLDGAVPPKPMVCGPGGPCVCPAGGKSGACIVACQGPSDCGPDLACAAGHCVAKPCATDADCSNTSTVDYACSATHVCAPKACASDADCGGHYCVDKTCYPQAGMCVPPAA